VRREVELSARAQRVTAAERLCLTIYGNPLGSIVDGKADLGGCDRAADHVALGLERQEDHGSEFRQRQVDLLALLQDLLQLLVPRPQTTAMGIEEPIP